MAAELIFAPEAEKDIAEAYGWYEQQRFGHGEQILTCVDACIEGICRMLDMTAFAHETYRRRFPYVIFYEHLQSVVTAYGVFHTSQDPAKWRKRL